MGGHWVILGWMGMPWAAGGGFWGGYWNVLGHTGMVFEDTGAYWDGTKGYGEVLG